MSAIWLLFLVVSYAAAVPLSEQAVLKGLDEGAPTQDPSGGLIGWYDPRERGGRLIDYTIDDLGEPLNVIISGLSDPHILTDKGFQDYTKSLGYSQECLGLHYGNRHYADLGDGDMQKIELILARQHYFPVWGTCWESLAGGHHFRAWRQNGTHANSGAWFIGASKEFDSSKNHKIVPNGWNLGRDWFVESAVAGTHYRNHWWEAGVEWRTDLLEEGSDGINHGIAQDGRVAVLTVKRL
ncbi:hypothetical protein FA13DRAFT_1740493 [Coprinellus micaceus]|uniref:Secreted protein n=1 Tax=Coprinellus micaceus TaxID=71717 RepID=A0A4Y7SM87_COPMI|nr:hypothetical protein FA13DRAFT_1740493 [Coprinellus micaceus]